MMPKKNGLEVLKSVREKENLIPVLSFSSKNTPTSKVGDELRLLPT